VADRVCRRVTSVVCRACKRRRLRYVATRASVERKCRRIRWDAASSRDRRPSWLGRSLAPPQRRDACSERRQETRRAAIRGRRWLPATVGDLASTAGCSVTWRRSRSRAQVAPIVASSVSESKERNLSFRHLRQRASEGGHPSGRLRNSATAVGAVHDAHPAALCLRHSSYFRSNSQPCDTGHEALFAIRKRGTLAAPNKALERSFPFCEQPQCA
jgi:hypothetical protein